MFFSEIWKSNVNMRDLYKQEEYLFRFVESRNDYIYILNKNKKKIENGPTLF